MNNEVATVEKPNGPMVFIPELGCEVGTFTDHVGKRGSQCLMHHVPVKMRGAFRPEQLANYDAGKEYRTDAYGFVLCYATTTTGSLCRHQAENRYPRCIVHGGGLHPYDKLVKTSPKAREKENAERKPLTRYQQFLEKIISVEDLDDEEIMNFGFRKPNGGIYKPRNIPREVVNEFTKAIYDRALTEIKTNAVEAAKTLASIMTDQTNDASIRLKAAESILDRSIGKAPQQLNISAGAPWEEIFEGITTLTRAQSRVKRGEIIDADVVSTSDTGLLDLNGLGEPPAPELPDALK